MVDTERGILLFTGRSGDDALLRHAEVAGRGEGGVCEYDSIRAPGSGEAVEGVDGGTLRSTALW